MQPLGSNGRRKRGKKLIRPDPIPPPQLMSSNPVATFAGSMDAKKRLVFSDNKETTELMRPSREIS